jgi:spermidine synthase
VTEPVKPASPPHPTRGSRIFGYAPDAIPTGHVVGQTTRLFLLFGSATLAVDQLLIVQPKLYLSPLGGNYANGFRALGVALLVAGFVCSRFWTKPHRSPFFALLLTAGLVGLSGPCRFFAFDRPLVFALLASAVAATAALTLGVALHRIIPLVRRWLPLRDGTFVYLHPFALTVFVITLVTAAVLSNVVGPLRSSLVVSGGLGAAALLTVLDEPHRAIHPNARWFGYLLFLALGLTAIDVESRCPLRRVLSSSHPLVYTTHTDRVTIDVTVGQGGVHYFVNGELRFSTVDERRWSETLVLPAMTRLRQPKQALVLSQGEGLIERELLAASDQIRVTSVMRDRRLAESARRQAYLRRLTHDSMRSARVTLVERDPAAFALKLDRERYDVIIVDLPDPTGPLEAKYYSRLFYEQLATHLDITGMLVVQATSARRSPRSYAVIGATLAAVGLKTTPIMVPLVARGEWSLYLCTHGDLPQSLDLDRYRKSFPGSLEAQLMSPWPDTLPPQDFVAKPSTIHDAIILDWFEYDAEHPSHG